MPRFTSRSLYPVILSGLSSTLLCFPALAQFVVPAADGVGTTVSPVNGDRFDITGGTQAGSNLFHSFEQFGLTQGQIANFIAQPEIRNVLGRVVGGDPSFINGLVQLSNSNANLYLLNPAGIVFGRHSSLNVPAAFYGTTADAIGFAGDRRFNAVGSNDWTTLTGAPNSFIFESPNSGSIVNFGQLAVREGQNLSLIAGNTITLGQLSAPGGTIAIAAVPGENRVRLSQEGHLLSLDLPLNPENSNPLQGLTPLDLPQLLTGSGVAAPNGSGNTIVSGTVDVSGNLGGQVNIIGDRATLTNAEVNASGLLGGGAINIGGSFQGNGPLPNSQITAIDTNTIINAHALDRGDGGNIVIWSDNSTEFFGQIGARGGFASGNGGFVEVSGKSFLDYQGTVDTTALQGTNGTLLLDPTTIEVVTRETAQTNNLADADRVSDIDIDRANRVTRLDAAAINNSSSNVILEAEESINFRAPINITQPGIGLTARAGTEIFVDNGITTNGGDLLLNASNVGADSPLRTRGGTVGLAAANIGVDNIDTSSQFGAGGTVQITAQEALSTGRIDTSSSLGDGGSVTINSEAREILTGRINSSSTAGRGGDVSLNAFANIIVNSINAEGATAGGNIELTANQFVRATDRFTARNGVSVSLSTASDDDSRGGTITIEHGGNESIPFIIGNSTSNGTAAAITRGNSTDESTIFPTLNLFSSEMKDRDRIQILTGTIFDEPFAPPEMPTGESLESLPPSPSPQGMQRSAAQVAASRDPRAIALSQSVGRSSTSASVQRASAAENSDSVFSSSGSDEIFSQIEGLDDVRATVSGHLDGGNLNAAVLSADRLFSDRLSVYTGELYGVGEDEQSLEQFQQRLGEIEAITGKKTVIIYVLSRPEQLDLIVVTPDGQSIYRHVPNLNQANVLETVRKFREELTNIRKRNTISYLPYSQQLYEWIVAPIEDILDEMGADILAFSMDLGLNSIPLAALHDGEQFLIEKYSLGLIPSILLTNTDYQALQNSQVLAFGASEFQQQAPLPAVPVELSTITEQLWTGKSFLNEQFTLDNLISQREVSPAGILHLATHAEFNAGSPQNSYIQLWDEQLTLDNLPNLGWNDPQVELLVLSACRTAVGDPFAELGFAGLAVQAGVKSALASLWYVSDEGTLALMTQFYEQLQNAAIKSEALRAAQLAMLRGEVRIEGDRLRGNRGESVILPSSLRRLGTGKLAHPYYWSGFTMIGSPW
ncbi:CHAT domain-containing protein [Roseofilum casamattae]|uniref:CHAT domain-containing protein n=1 Tax=Roseofilum casamattae BLCC-M143 TaxID=3022442 RepID=A0ABT7BRQ2_9CYAN|nr:CHAT domain-containing protein [Roseofilum casamattae]MDJ1181874.1 CHAT domain-containing protein [Roseofilum casamattae BLCC-M143]